MQLGLWSMLPDPFIAEMLTKTGYGRILPDTEHSPSDLRIVASQLQATRGAQFVAVAADMALLQASAEQLARSCSDLKT